MLDIIAIFLSVTALLAYVNRRYVGLPSAIGVMGRCVRRPLTTNRLASTLEAA